MTANGTGTRRPAPATARAVAASRDHGLPPPRVRKLLDGIRRIVLDRVGNLLATAFDEDTKDLFAQADKAPSSAVQQAHFDTLRSLAVGRERSLARFREALEREVERIGSRNADDRAAAPPSTANLPEALELVETDNLEQDLAIEEIAGKNELRHHLTLHRLAHRFAILAGLPAWEPADLPLGPHRLMGLLRDAIADLNLAGEYRVGLLRAFDRTAMREVGKLYEATDAYLVEQQILPNLRLFRSSGPAGVSADTRAETTAPNQQPGEDESDHPAAESAFAAASESNGDRDLFQSLRQLLATSRGLLGPAFAPSGEGDGNPVSRADLQAVLSAMQRAPAAYPAAGGARPMLRRDVFTRLQAAGPQNLHPQLAAEDRDTIDIVDLLFDQIVTREIAGHGAGLLLGPLQYAVLRVALADKKFFAQQSHPTRVFLDTLANAAARWIDSAEPDPEISGKLKAVSERVGTGYDGDVGLFADAHAELSRYLESIARRAESTERRNVEAAKGRERLDIARQRAQAVIARFLERGNPPALVRTLLEQAWTDVLALTILREGEDSATYRRRLAVADRLSGRGPAHDGPANKALREELETGLSLIGLHHDELRALCAGLFDTGVGAPIEAANDTDAAARIESVLQRKARFGHGAQAGPSDPADVARNPEPPKPLDAREEAELQRLRKLPFGTWFEFVTNQQGTAARRKLAWYSSVTGHCLFVNLRGVRSAELTMAQLARDIVRGQIRQWSPPPEKSLLERAWDAVKRLLDSRQDSGSAATTPQPLGTPA